jgi:hypothetical protein
VAKFPCRCSYVISLTNSPVPEQLTIVPNALLYELAEVIEEGGISFDGFFSRIDAVGLDAIACPVCGRIWIKKPEDSEYWSYIKEHE